jgi:hypothetical protein
MTSLSHFEELLDSSLYVNWQELRKALDSWTIAAKFIFRTPKKMKTSAVYKC